MHRITRLLAAMAFALATGGTSSARAALIPPADEVALTVNVVTGEVRLVGNAADPAEMRSYQIGSLGGSLDSTQWNSLTLQGFGGWEDFDPVPNGAVTEITFTNSPLTINDVGISLGALFRPGFTQDLQFGYTEQDNDAANPEGLTGAITYVPEPSTAAVVFALAGLSTLRRRRQA